MYSVLKIMLALRPVYSYCYTTMLHIAYQLCLATVLHLWWQYCHWFLNCLLLFHIYVYLMFSQLFVFVSQLYLSTVFTTAYICFTSLFIKCFHNCLSLFHNYVYLMFSQLCLVRVCTCIHYYIVTKQLIVIL